MSGGFVTVPQRDSIIRNTALVRRGTFSSNIQSQGVILARRIVVNEHKALSCRTRKIPADSFAAKNHRHVSDSDERKAPLIDAAFENDGGGEKKTKIA